MEAHILDLLDGGERLVDFVLGRLVHQPQVLEVVLPVALLATALCQPPVLLQLLQAGTLCRILLEHTLQQRDQIVEVITVTK